MIRLTQPHND